MPKLLINVAGVTCCELIQTQYTKKASISRSPSLPSICLFLFLSVSHVRPHLRYFLLRGTISCPTPKVNNAVRIPDSRTSVPSASAGSFCCDDVVVFACDAGFRLVGSGIVMRCREDGQWYQLHPGYCRIARKYTRGWGSQERRIKQWSFS